MASAVDLLRPALRAAANELELEVTDAQLDALLAYLSLLQRWNAHYNLTAVRDPEQMLTQHLTDCLAVIGPLRRQTGAGAGAGVTRLLDVGSGGGLPGAVIAILDPRIDVTCVDTVGKKAAFVQQVAAELQLRNLHSQHARVEQISAAPFDFVASRAFASLSDFTSLTGRHLSPDGVWMAMKGKTPTDELAALPNTIDVFHVEQLKAPGLDAARCIVWMRPKG